MFSPVVCEEKTIGYKHEADGLVVFFGTRHLQKEAMGQHFHKLNFYFLKQVHGNAIVPVSQGSPTADAHYSFERGAAPCIQTADCIPVMLSSGDYVVAIHAGWRGIANGVIPRSIDFLRSINSSLQSPTKAFIGPHIGANSFEVGLDVATQIQEIYKPLKNLGAVVFDHPKHSDKRFIDLTIIAQSQLVTHGVSKANIFCFAPDTFSSAEFHSFRRDHGEAGRQISFIARILD